MKLFASISLILALFGDFHNDISIQEIVNLNKQNFVDFKIKNKKQFENKIVAELYYQKELVIMNEILDFVSHYHKIINIHKGFFTYRYTEPNSLGENDFSGAIIYDSNVYRYSCKIKLFVDEEGTIVVDKDLIFKSPSHISLESEEINLAMTCTDSLHGIYSTNGTWIEWKKLIFKDQKLAFEEFSWQQGILNEKRKPRIIKLD